jgi:hypothetical protein
VYKCIIFKKKKRNKTYKGKKNFPVKDYLNNATASSSPFLHFQNQRNGSPRTGQTIKHLNIG